MSSESRRRHLLRVVLAFLTSGWLLLAHGQSLMNADFIRDLESRFESADSAFRDYTIESYVPLFGGSVVTGSRESLISGKREPFLAAVTINHEILNVRSLRAASQPQSTGGGSDMGTPGGSDLPCVTGFLDTGPATPYHAFRWTEATGPVDLGTLDPANDASRSSIANAITGDCSAVVGTSDTASGAIQHAFRWTQTGGMADLGAPAGAARASRAFGVSADGTVVVGEAEFADAAAFSGFRNGAYRWSGGSFQALGSLTGGYPSLAVAVSADAATIVGGASVATSPTTTGQQAFRWTEATGMVSLGTLPGVVRSLATGVSDNGRIVAGTTSTTPGGALTHHGSLGFDRGDGAFRWTEATGLRDLRQLMIDAGVDMTGITLLSVKGVSPDGQWIFGDATTPTTPGGETSSYLIQYCDDDIGAPCVAATGSGVPFTFGASSSSLTVAAGSSATATLTIMPQAGFSGTVSFACSGLPAGAACSFSPATVTPPAGSAATTSLTIATNGGPVALWLREHPATALAGLLPLLAFRRRRSAARACALALAAATLVSCGGGSSDGGSTPPTGTPAGSSTVTVTATSGSGASEASRAVALTLTVTR